jgi:hypothetical protein
MTTSFPWPVTDDDLLMNNALEDVMRLYNARGRKERAYVQEAATNLIVEAYKQGVRDEEALVHYALKSLSQGKRETTSRDV